MSDLDDESLAAAVTIACAALSAPDEAVPLDDFFEVDCPNGVCPGDTIDVSVPSQLGGGQVCVTVPAGVGPGETFEVPLETRRSRHRRRHHDYGRDYWGAEP